MSIELLVLDVDGTLTDGSIIYSSNGEDIKSFNVKDGFGIEGWIKLGKKAAIITGRTSKIIQRRANELKIEYFFEGVRNKKEVLSKLMSDLSLDSSQVASIGDDLNDLNMFSLSGISFAPFDAIEYVRNNADVVLTKKGGDGAVREMIEYILKRDGLEDKFIEPWL